MRYALAFSPTRGLNNRIHRDHRRGRRNCLHVSDPFHMCTLAVAVGLGCCVTNNAIASYMRQRRCLACAGWKLTLNLMQQAPAITAAMLRVSH